MYFHTQKTTLFQTSVEILFEDSIYCDHVHFTTKNQNSQREFIQDTETKYL